MNDETHSLSGLRFLFIVLLWLIIGAVLIFGLVIPQRLNSFVDIINHIRQSGSSLFRFCDDWNFLLMSSLISICVIVFSMNDRILRRYINKESKNFYSAGTTWAIRHVANLALFFVQIGIFCLILTHAVTTPSIFTETEDLPKIKYNILLLGTSKFIRPHGENKSPRINAYYQARINSVIALFKSGRIKSILISGDRHGNYNEPEDMKRDLIIGGISSEIISEDFDGFRTFDSILRMRSQTVGNSQVLIVSQYFHLERAIYMARQNGMNAKGFAASGSMTLPMIQREFLAKPRVLLDIYLLNTQVSGVAAYPRRKISFEKAGDLIILLVVAGSVLGAGRMTRDLLHF